MIDSNPPIISLGSLLSIPPINFLVYPPLLDPLIFGTLPLMDPYGTPIFGPP